MKVLLTVLLIAYPGDLTSRDGFNMVFEDMQTCFKGEIAARADARSRNQVVVTACHPVYDGGDVGKE